MGWVENALPSFARPGRAKVPIPTWAWLVHASLICCQREIGEVPLARQALGERFAGGFHELAQVGRVVDIKSDARERQHHAWLLRGPRCRQMWFETIISKTQGKQSRGTPPGCVGASSVRGRDEHGAFSRSGFQNFLELASLDQRNVAGDDQRAIYVSTLAESGCHFDSIGLTTICVVGNDLETEPSCEFECKGIAGNDANLGSVCPRAQRLQHIEKHGLSQLGSGWLIEHPCQTLLGVGQALDGDKNHDGSAARALSALSRASTVRASLALSSAVRMMVLVQCTCSPGRSNFLAASTSRTSAIRISRKSS